MAKDKDSYVPKDIQKEVPKENLKQLEILYKLADVINEVADLKNFSLHHITDDDNKEHYKLLNQKVLELKHQLNIFLPEFVKELKNTNNTGTHHLRFSSKKVIDTYLNATAK